MSKRPDFKTFKEKMMQNAEFRKKYEDLREEFEVIEQFIKARNKADISQKELAKKLKLQQPAIARLEKGGYTSTSVSNLSKIAHVLGYSLKISLRAKKR